LKIRGWMCGYSVKMVAAVALAVLVFSSANGGLREEYGDGLWHDIGSGWQYLYVSSIDSGYWLCSGVVRFGFDYDPGQWWHQGTTWTTLSGIGLAEGDWVGDGSWHNLNNNGWSYRYLTSITSGYWNNAGTTRFGYHYSGVQWWDNWNGWGKLGSLGVSQAFIGDGEFHDLNNGWSYKYVTSISSGYWNNAGTTRFGYHYSAGQWWDNWNGWEKLGSLGVSQAFIGDGTWHGLNPGWSYSYSTAISSGFWNNGIGTRFGYDYGAGQWWDFLPHLAAWGRLGPGNIDQAFIGDGNYHYFADSTVSDWFHYRSDIDTYKWGSGAQDNAYYKYSFTDKSWYKYDGHSWSSCKRYDKYDVRYIGAQRFVESYLHNDWGIGVPDPGYKDITYICYEVDTDSYWKTLVAKWAVNRPGDDGIWSGGNLNVVFCTTTNGISINDFHQGFAEYTIEDTVVFKESMDSSGLDKTVEWLGIVREYYGTLISNVAFQAHGYCYGWQIGEMISMKTYNTVQNMNLFLRWAKYMADDAQILSYHCEVGLALSMLNEIARWTGCDIFAHDHVVWSTCPHVDNSKPIEPSADQVNLESYHWNNNLGNVHVVHDGKSNVFEYKSNSSVTPHELFEVRDDW